MVWKSRILGPLEAFEVGLTFEMAAMKRKDPLYDIRLETVG